MPRGGNAHDRRKGRRAATRDGAQGASRALHSVSTAVETTEIQPVETPDYRGQLAAAAVALEPSPARAALATVAEALAEDTAAMGDCANCDHPAEMHAGVDNTDACTEQGCSCAAFEELASAEASAALLAAPTVPETISIMLDNILLNFAERRSVTLEEAAAVFAAAAFDELSTPAEVQAPVMPEAGLRWTATIVPEGTLTDDGRAFAPGAVTWRELPLTLAAMLDTPHADVVMKAEACGRIDRIWREGTVVKAEGVFDSGEYGQKIAQMVGDGTVRGISVDIAVHESEVRPRSDFFDEDGQWREVPLESEVDMLDVLFGEPTEQPIFVVTAGVIGSVTVCPFPAFAAAQIAIAASLVAAPAPNVWTLTGQHGMIITQQPGLEVEVTGDATVPVPLAQVAAAIAAVTASAVEEGLAPLHPPAAWFNNPELDEPTPLTLTDDGRIYGHAAPWDTCHIAIPDVCTTAPHSLTDYAGFLLKEVECDDGTRVSCGTITLETGHAGRSLNAEAATAHYDNTGLAAADVVVGEDEHGIWFAGALRPDVNAVKARALRGAVLSGDWRQVRFVDGTANLELVALLAVNVPGFPIPRTRALIAAGADGGLEVLALTAAGVHAGTTDEARLNKIRALGDVAAGRYASLAARAARDEG